ncbi:MAG: radical SAM protein [bacterium]|nr:radical SAM protein [bacterium]
MRAGKITKGTNRLKMLFTPPRARNITRFQFAVTYLCNSRCTTCNIWEIYHKYPEKIKEEMTLGQIIEIFDSIKYMKNIKQISFTGGEPFLRKDFVDIYLFFADKYKDSSLYAVTNAINNELILDEIREIGRKSDLSRLKLGISIDGVGKNHDQVRGIKGGYEKALNLVSQIKSDYPEVELNFSFTISENNYKDIKEVYRIAKEYQVLFSIRFAQTSGSFYQNEEMSFVWKEEILEEINGYLKDIISEMYQNQDFIEKLFRLDIFFLKRLIEYQKEQKRIFKCYSGTHSFFLDPYGSIYPCINLKDVYGNVKKENFNDFWLSMKAKEIRKMIKRNECHCWTECETIPSLQRNPLPLVSNFINFILNM